MVKASKTKYMLVGGTERDRTHLGSSVTIDGDIFEVMDKFVYLGSLLTAEKNVTINLELPQVPWLHPVLTLVLKK